MLDGQRLPTNFDRKPTIRNKIHGKEILPFVTQYQPSVSTIKKA